ncbi:hypothetical protein CN311_07425 [Mesorhizobium sanjuanii]|uniref:Uncharacterized protein n=1 Tax=Mesorhizobium sanjuanii TaxID=2037900 RepID=A0A2A6FIE9_9HYPH|nr:hypothetical protein CN311_07425 [Mesorhizobium sanjuanii]
MHRWIGFVNVRLGAVQAFGANSHWTPRKQDATADALEHTADLEEEEDARPRRPPFGRSDLW